MLLRPILQTALALFVGLTITGCGRGPRGVKLDTFTHDTRLLPALPTAGGVLTLHGSTPLWIGGDAATEIFSPDPTGSSWSRHDAMATTPVAASRAIAGRDGVLVLGDTALLWLQPSGRSYTLSALPPLPDGWHPQAGAVARAGIFVIAAQGAGTPRVFSLPAGPRAGAASWRDWGDLPPALTGAIHAAIQLDGDRPRLYVVGREGSPDVLALHSLEFQRRRWFRHGSLPRGSEPVAFVPAGVANLYAVTPGEWHVFNTVTQTWVGPIAVPSAGEPVAAVVSGTRITSLHRGPDGTARVLDSVYTVRSRSLHWLDYGILAAFILGLLGIGWLHARKGGSAEQYFRGGRKVNWLAAGLSIVATRLSATSFVSIPAKSFATNWQYALVPLTNFVGAFIMSRWFVRFFVRLNVTSGYEYLEKRFSPAVRTLGSLNYLAYELARIGILILVPAVALSAIARFDLATTIVVIGVIVTAYTAVGGIEGVIWADTFQIAVKIVGLLLATVLIFLQLQGSPAELAASAWQAGKLRLVDVSWDFTRDTLWVFLLFWLTDGLKSYVANQTIIQRFISTRDESTARSTIWSSAFIGTGVSWLLLLLGTGLFLFYQQSPARLDLTMDKPDAVFPWFIVFELPPGVVGLLLAALIAAAMSSLDGALNSTSTVMVTDFYKRFHRNATDAGAVRLGRLLTLVIGLLATVIALLMSGMAAKSLFDQTLKVIGLFGGGLGGLFLVGMLTTRTGTAAAVLGFAASAGVQYYVSNHTSLHLLTYMFTGMGSCILVGWLAGWIWPERRDLAGLTVHTYR